MELNDLKKQLTDHAINEGLDYALSRLGDVLKDDAPHRNQYIQLRMRYQDYAKRQVIGGESSKELIELFNTLSHSFIQLVGFLTDLDIKPDLIEIPRPPSKRGQLLYHIPHEMRERKAYPCKIRVAYLEELLREDWNESPDDVHRDNIRVAELMAVELLNVGTSDPAFEIQSLRDDPVQFLDQDDYTEWNFYVTPLKQGTFPLLLKVSILETRKGRDIKKDVIVEEHVVVTHTAPEKVAETLKIVDEAIIHNPRPARANIHYGTPEVPNPSAKVEDRFKPIGRGHGQGMRAVAFFLAFLVLAPSFMYAIAPPIKKDWYKTTILDNDEDGYEKFIQKWEKDADQANNPLLETARYRKVEILTDEASKDTAVVDAAVAAIRAYEQKHYSTGAKHEGEVIAKLKTLEAREMQVVRQNPSVVNISEFVQRFPDSEKLPEVQQIVMDKTDAGGILLPQIEAAYVKSIEMKPAAQRVETFLNAFPETEKLPQVVAAIDKKPNLLAAVEPIILKSIEAKPTVSKTQTYLRAIPTANVQAVEKAVQKDRTVERAVQNDLNAAKKAQNTTQSSIAEEPEPSQEEAQNPQPSVVAEPATTAPPTTTTNKDKAAATGIEESKADTKTEVKTETPSSNTKTEATAAPQSTGDRNRKSGLEMKRVPGGTFDMGSNDYDDEKPVHSVTLSSYHIGKYEVTQADWRSVMGSDPEELRFGGCDDCPVENVSWNDIQDFLKKLNAKTGKKYRLPTEAEWEFAAKGGKNSGLDYAGSNSIEDVAWYDGNAQSKTHPVGTKKANSLGLYDMSGNVWEWCSDWYGSDYYANSPENNPKGPQTGRSRVLRGGSWYSLGDLCRVSYRYYDYPTDRSNYNGFRLAQD